MNFLGGIRIHDLSRVLTGPWCTQPLGWHIVFTKSRACAAYRLRKWSMISWSRPLRERFDFSIDMVHKPDHKGDQVNVMVSGKFFPSKTRWRRRLRSLAYKCPTDSRPAKATR